MARKISDRAKKQVGKAATAAAAAAAVAAAAKVATVVKRRKSKAGVGAGGPCVKTPAFRRPVEVTLRFRGPKNEEVVVQLDPKKIDAVVWSRKAVNDLTKKREKPKDKFCPKKRPDGIAVLKSCDDGDAGVGMTRMALRMSDREGGSDDGGEFDGTDYGGCYWIDGQIICWGGSME